LAIQHNEVDRFFELLPEAIICFQMFGHHNYRNSCTAFLLQWLEWQAAGHPAVALLRRHFKACSEEYGEMAICRLMQHIREWDFQGDNVARRWEESRSAAYCFEALGIKRSHREDGTKWHDVNLPDRLMSKLGDAFSELCLQAHNSEMEALIGNPGFTLQSARSDDLSFWADLSINYALARAKAIFHVSTLKSKLQRRLKDDALHAIDVDTFFF
jgi:hypothetical protein